MSGLCGLPSLALAQTGSSGAAQKAAPSSSEPAVEMEMSMEEKPAAGVSKGDFEVARAHFANGVALLQETPANYQDAWQQFRLALEKSGGSWKVRGNLGYCALKLERDGEALTHYREYLTRGGDNVDPKERADIENELLLIEGNMSWVTLSSSAPNVELAVSRQGSTAPTQAYALENGEAKLGLRAGNFTITASSGGKTLSWEPLLTPGKQATHHFDFQAELQPAANDTEQQPDQKPEQPASRGPSTLRWIGYGTAGVGVLALGGGVITGVLAKNKEEQAKENCLGTVCPEVDESKKNSAQSLATTANVLFIAGGVLAATGITLVIVGGPAKAKTTAQLTPGPQLTPGSRRAPEPERTLQLSPGVAAGGGALFLSGTY